MSAIFDSKMIVEFIMGNVVHKNDDIINDTKLQVLLAILIFLFSK